MNEAEKRIKAMAKSIQEADEILDKALKNKPDYTRVILLGSSGVGKSTISNVIIGKKLSIVKKKNGVYLETDEDTPFRMGNVMRPETAIPNVFIDDEHEIIICDAPGFEDGRSIEQDIINSFAIDKLFKEPCKVKIMIVFSEDESKISAGRARAVRVNLAMLNQIIPNTEQLMKGIGLILTQCDPQIDIEEKLKEIEEGNTPEVKNFIIFFKANYKERVFLFPKAAGSNGSTYELENKQQLIDFFTKDTISNPEHKIVLSATAIKEMYAIANQIGHPTDLVKELIEKIHQVFTENGEDIDSLTNMNSKLIEVQKSLDSIKTPLEFVNKVIEIFKNNMIEDSLRKIKCYNSFYTFFDSVPEQTCSFQLHYFSELIKKTVDEEINKVVSLIHHKKLSKDLIEYKKMMDSLKLTVEQKQQEQIKLENEINRLTNELKSCDKKSDSEIREISFLLQQNMQRLCQINQIQRSDEKAKSSFNWDTVLNFLSHIPKAMSTCAELYDFYKDIKKKYFTEEPKKSKE